MSQSGIFAILVEQVEDCVQGEGVDFAFDSPLDSCIIECLKRFGEYKIYDNIATKMGFIISNNEYKAMGVVGSMNFRLSFNKVINKVVLNEFESALKEYAVELGYTKDRIRFNYRLFSL